MVAMINPLDGAPLQWIERIHLTHAARGGNCNVANVGLAYYSYVENCQSRSFLFPQEQTQQLSCSQKAPLHSRISFLDSKYLAA